MKRKITVILLTIGLLAGCEAAPAPAQENTPDIDAVVQQSVEKDIAQYKESQKEKDAKTAAWQKTGSVAGFRCSPSKAKQLTIPRARMGSFLCRSKEF